MLTIQLLAGFILLLGGGEALVKGAVGVAGRLGVSPMLIGFLLVGFGTSTPELVASLNAALAGAPGIAVGNVIGSNIANILLILGVAGLILPMAVNRDAFLRDGAMLVVATVLFVGAALFGEIGVPAALVFLAVLAAYSIYSFRTDRKEVSAAAAQMHAAEADDVDLTPPVHPNLWLSLLLAVGGIAAVIWGADLLVDGAIVLARSMGMSETLIGLTLVAVGTSLPELVTSVMAAIRKHADVAVGNVIGSNVFNLLGIMGITALVKPIPVPPEVLRLDLWVMSGVTALLLVFAITGWRLARWEAGVLLALYGVYMAVLFT
ncbi:MAG: sodium:calcium antiporter [Rhodospirillaceae bacterium BRH_c57]|nr:MAG: sodium:calcium antiporter [Rhodospirillaceae bacterium BRH_c57]